MISAKRRMEVLKLYFEGLSYDEISKAARISKGS
jgi:DNA-directed RNA polymerase specialized sigma24 family protein